jgi:hypothetical protein
VTRLVRVKRPAGIRRLGLRAWGTGEKLSTAAMPPPMAADPNTLFTNRFVENAN